MCLLPSLLTHCPLSFHTARDRDISVGSVRLEGECQSLPADSVPPYSAQKAPCGPSWASLFFFLVITCFLMALLLFASPSEISCRGD